MAKGNNSEGDRENGKGERIVGKGQRVVLKGEPPNEGELDFFFFFFLVSHFPFRHKYTIISHN